MRRAIRSTLAALVALSTGPVLAQDLPESRAEWFVLGRVSSESGRAVPGARISFVPDSADGLDWLGALGSSATPTEGISDERGAFRFAVRGPSGAILAERADRLGIVIARASSKAPLRIVLEPMAEVRRIDGHDIDAFVVALPRNERPVPLGRRNGPSLRLPAGRYLLMFQGERRAEMRVDLRSGTHEELDIPSRPEIPTDLDAGIEAIAERWRQAGDLVRRGSVPDFGGPVAWTLRRQDAEGTRVTRTWTRRPSTTDLDTRAPWHATKIVDDLGHAIVGARVIGIRIASGGAQPSCESQSDAEGIAHFLATPAATEGTRDVVVVVAQGKVFAVEMANDLLGELQQIVLHDAVVRRIRIVDEDAIGIDGARVRIPSTLSPWLDRTFRSDASGFVDLPATAAGPLALKVDSDHHVPCGVTLAAHADRIEAITLKRGLVLRGRVQLTDGKPGADVDVQIREPSGRSDFAPRFAVSAADGSFVFEGLPDSTFTLFAQASPGGVTWSGQRVGTQPNGDEWTIVLRCEDPEPPRRDR
ncbi:MAG: carboxypeptidase-like regulatory domain-containing protein [Planctomycetota bacterium]